MSEVWSIRYEQGEPVEVIEPGLLLRRMSAIEVALIRQARADRDAEFLAAIEEERQRELLVCEPSSVVLSVLVRLRARFKEKP